jgi:hypothetical protein
MLERKEGKGGEGGEGGEGNCLDTIWSTPTIVPLRMSESASFSPLSNLDCYGNGCG